MCQLRKILFLVLIYIFGVVSDTCIVENQNNIICRNTYVETEGKDLEVNDQFSEDDDGKLNLVLNNCFGGIDNDSFPNLREITSLYLNHCKLDTFVLPSLPKLVYIRITNSKLPNITENTFRNTDNIVTMDILAAPSQVFECGCFQYMHKLKHLTIHGLTLHYIANPCYTKGLNSLETLSISGNVNHLDPKFFDNMPNLKTLDLSNTRVARLPNDLFRSVKHLKHLFLLGTKLKNVNTAVFNSIKGLASLGLPTPVLKSINFRKLKRILNHLNELNIFDAEKGSATVKDVLQKIGNSWSVVFRPRNNPLHVFDFLGRFSPTNVLHSIGSFISQYGR